MSDSLITDEAVEAAVRSWRNDARIHVGASLPIEGKFRRALEAAEAVEAERDERQAEYFEQKQPRKDWAGRASEAEQQRDKALAALREIANDDLSGEGDWTELAQARARKVIDEIGGGNG